MKGAILRLPHAEPYTFLSMKKYYPFFTHGNKNWLNGKNYNSIIVSNKKMRLLKIAISIHMSILGPGASGHAEHTRVGFHSIF